MGSGLSSPSSNGGIWYGAYKYVTFVDADSGKTLQVETKSSGNPIQIQLFSGAIDPTDHAWRQSHSETVVSTGAGPNLNFEVDSRLHWTIRSGSYTLVFADYSSDETLADHVICYRLVVTK
jgi:hypothetical protein